jgi:FkbM family methyltransferase
MRMIMRILIKVLGKIKGQAFLEYIYLVALKYMNFGRGYNYNKSGELNVIKHIGKYYSGDLSLVIFDVGANVGNYTKALSEFYTDRAVIHSFEPSKKTYETFLETTGDLKNVIPNNFGFSDTETHQLLYTDADGSGYASTYQRNLVHFGITMDKSEEIKLSTIDNYCRINNIEKIHFLKLDIEGHELKALNGAKEMIRNRKIDFIQFEFGGCNIDSRTFFQDFFYLLKDNYTLYRILKNGLFEITEYKETYEIFITANYLAITKE